MKKEKVTLSVELAKSLYKTASIEAKKEFEVLFGKEALSAPFIERVTCMDDCYEEADLPKVNDISDIPEEFHEWLLGLYRGAVVAKAFNGSERLSMRNPDQKRYQAWLGCSPSGFSFRVTYYCGSDAYAGDASRLLFLDAASAKKAFEIAPEVYETIANQ
jgi:hypothetical protein